MKNPDLFIANSAISEIERGDEINHALVAGTSTVKDIGETPHNILLEDEDGEEWWVDAKLTNEILS